MHSSLLLLPAFLAARCIASLDFALLPRANTDNMTTAEYNCHDNCGEAILDAKNENQTVLCEDKDFKTDYANCLQCAGPDNEDIWKYYGAHLTEAAAACGLATTPEAGTKAAVGTAVPFVSSSVASASASATGSGSVAATTGQASKTAAAATASATDSAGAGSALQASMCGLLGSFALAGGLVALAA